GSGGPCRLLSAPGNEARTVTTEDARRKKQNGPAPINASIRFLLGKIGLGRNDSGRGPDLVIAAPLSKSFSTFVEARHKKATLYLSQIDVVFIWFRQRANPPLSACPRLLRRRSPST